MTTIPTNHMTGREVGDTGLELSVFGLGTMTFGAESDTAMSHAILDRYYESGGRFIDTADVYSQGVSEEIIGDWLAERAPDDVTLATKARFATGASIDDRGAGRSHILRAVEASLRRLRIDTIDLYQMHAWDPEVPLEETLGVLNELVASGKVRHIGVSNYLGWQLERAVQLSEHNGWKAIETLQPQYNLLAREIELDSLPVCLEHGIGILPWSPLGGGWLTGKYNKDRAPTGATRLGEDPGRGVEAYDLRNRPRTWQVLDTVEAIAQAREVSMAQVALNWLRNRPGVTSVILGCRTTGQLDDNLDALHWELDDSEMTALDEVSAPGIPDYPHGFLEANAGMDIWERLSTRIEPPL